MNNCFLKGKAGGGREELKGTLEFCSFVCNLIMIITIVIEFFLAWIV
jgi:hypothetical protein